MSKWTQRGAGIIEILIALTLGVVIILGVTTLYSDSSRSLGDVTRATQLTETASYAMDLVTSDLELAGFWAEMGQTPEESAIKLGVSPLSGLHSGAAFASQSPPCTCVGTNIAAQCEHFNSSGANVELTYSNATPVELARAIFFPLYAAASPRLNAEAVATTNRCGAFDQASASSEFVAIRRSSTCSATTEVAQGCRSLDGAYHLQVWGDSNTPTEYATGDLLLTNDAAEMVARLADGSVSPAYRYISRIYYIDSDDVLSRLFLDDVSGSQTYLKEELVDGVELLRFEWSVDTDSDGYGDRLTNSPDPNDWVNVVGATVWMVIRESEPARGYTDSRTYEVAGASFSVPSGYAGHRRAVFSKTVELPNIAGRRRS